MEELVQKVVERTGITEEQARGAVETVADVLRERIPSPYNKYVDSFLKGEGMGGIFGGFFGK